MRNIARQGTFEDTDVIKYIVDGLQDHSGCAAPLYYCVSLDELREKMMRYQTVQAEFKRKPQAPRTAVPLRQSSSANISYARNADANKGALIAAQWDITAINARNRAAQREDASIALRLGTSTGSARSVYGQLRCVPVTRRKRKTILLAETRLFN